MSYKYDDLIKWYTRKNIPILYQEVLEDAKDKVEETTGLRPTNEKLLKGLRALGVRPRLKDHKNQMQVLQEQNPGTCREDFCSFCKK